MVSFEFEVGDRAGQLRTDLFPQSALSYIDLLD